ncbi:hypothetical protein [Helicobacter zhangjianzhongii]|uniref:Uncharacterized protein n=1 Tax=Helicobacter zhangjianzhongii TaxID=2974574 RepID=A0ACC6FSB7_9HELI|nr:MULTISPECIES: hypothetical protein [unclassified Helicobacter]MDL0079879.1 hypothetical protein [Helicobacter sp. CPD2-1]MDL0082025.1 hypothetical protein [Helicobacter sp. XJK30-2]
MGLLCALVGFGFSKETCLRAPPCTAVAGFGLESTFESNHSLAALESFIYKIYFNPINPLLGIINIISCVS